MDLTPEFQDLHVRLDGETTGDHICRIVRALDGVSFDHDRSRLEALFQACEDTAARAALVASWTTNCASFAGAVLALAGLDAASPLLTPLQVGQAMTRLRTAFRAGRMPATTWRAICPGAVMVYWSGDGNNAHAEIALSSPDAMGNADHGGAGRARNAVTCGHGSILTSSGRPLQEWYDPAQIVTNEASGDSPY